MYHFLNGTIVGIASSTSVPLSVECSTPWCIGLGMSTFNLFCLAVDILISYSYSGILHDTVLVLSWILGFVKAIDVPGDCIHLITPISHHLFEKIDIIFRSCIAVPACLLQVIVNRILFLFTFSCENKLLFLLLR